MFGARINDFDCNKRVEITNYAQAITRDGTKSDSAKVIAANRSLSSNCTHQRLSIKDKKIVTINESDFDAKKYSKNLKDCDPVVLVRIQVCRLSDKKLSPLTNQTLILKIFEKLERL